jgi:predicted homoserine dehydrogenase-like protein
MNLYKLLLRRAADQTPLRVALIGAGKFGSMFLAQARRTPGIHLAAVVDLRLAQARASLARTGWADAQYDAESLNQALRSSSTWLTEDVDAIVGCEKIDIVVDATGSPTAGIRHALACARHGKHIVMVNVEADALAGPLLARNAAQSGTVYSLAYGDQPALICELVDWARAAGFDVIAAGKGTKFLPAYHASTPETVWSYYGFTHEQVTQGDFNAQMFNSFLDGTKSAIEMTAVANATGLTPAPGGLAFPPCGVDDLPQKLKPRSEGGVLHHRGQVEVVSSLERDGTPVRRDLRWGVYVCFAADSDYVRRCFHEYGLVTDDTGMYSSLYKPYHLIGLELGISIASVGLRKEPTGSPDYFCADAVAIAKRDLRSGDMLDGEGGYSVYGRLVPAVESVKAGALPIGLASRLKVVRPVMRGEPVRWQDVRVPDSEAVRIRRQMERTFLSENDLTTVNRTHSAS